jgi:acetyltransferase-like isoleucine patch superfamily enzyme
MIRKVYYWVVGHIIAFFMYDKKYLSSRYFKGRFAGISSPGWMWTVTDFRGRWMLGVNRGVKFPVSFANTINGFQNIIFDPDNLDIFRGRSKYFQAEDGVIAIGKGTHIANNSCLVTTNHDLRNPDLHSKGKDIKIGESCWIGFGAIILPGVNLGDHTVVAAGSVVTKSFEEGYCVIGGNPARIIKNIE